MANIKAKELTKLEAWNTKELRKLKITINNRLSSLESLRTNDKELSSSHLLKGFELEDCKVLLEKVLEAEKKLS